MTSRRRFVAAVGSATAASLGLAGCVGDRETTTATEETTTTTEGTTTTTGGTTATQQGTPPRLRMGASETYVNAVSTSAGNWVKDAVQSEYTVDFDWVVAENGVTEFMRRAQQGVDLGADGYVGVTAADLARADRELSAPLFAAFDTDAVDNTDNVHDRFWIDGTDRMLPTGASYVTIIYDETVVDAPETLAALTTDEYSDGILVPNPQNTATGLAFVLWTVDAFGEDGFLEYWRRLADNGLQTAGSWNATYSAYSGGEAPMVMSYSTDQVYASQDPDVDMARHQVAFPGDSAYTYVSGTTKFESATNPALVDTFASFMLSGDTQRTVAEKNVGIPTVTNASLPAELREYVHVPETPISHSAETLRQHADEWRAAVTRQIASQ